MSCVAVAAPTNTAASPSPVSRRSATRAGTESTWVYSRVVMPDEEGAAAQQDPAAVAIAEAAGPWPHDGGGHRERAHHEADGEPVAAQHVLDVSGERGEQGSEGQEVGERGQS